MDLHAFVITTALAMLLSFGTIAVIIDKRASRRDRATREWWQAFYASHESALDSAYSQNQSTTRNALYVASIAAAKSSSEPMPSTRSRPALPYVGADERIEAPILEGQGQMPLKRRVVERLPNEDETRISRFDVEAEEVTRALVYCKECGSDDVRPTGGLWTCNSCSGVGVAKRSQQPRHDI